MAQERGARGRGLARRYGLACGALAALALAAALVCVTLLGGAPGGSVTIERTAQGDAAQGEKDGGAADDVARGEGDQGAAGDAQGDASPRATVAEPVLLVVHVDGAVAAPGVYALPEGSRANDAVAAAGGLVEGADTSGVNLAAPVSDGEKLHVPLEGETASAEAPAGSGGGEATAGPVNINVAGVEELDELPGVGEATARAIVEDREKNGPFSAPEDLMRVSGIGEKKFERIAGLICV